MADVLTQKILDAVDAFLLAHQTWADNDAGPAVPTMAYEMAVHALIKACDGDVPTRCREIVTAVSRLTIEWNDYARGIKRSGRNQDQPHPSLWAAVENLQAVRKGTSWRLPPVPEPVDYLISQKVSISQIALHIYAHNGRGPFITGDGAYDHNLVMQEKNEPGSVCKPGWWEALFSDDQRTAVASLRHGMDRPEHLLTDPLDMVTEDCASIEQLLREGAFPQQIARVKHTTVEEVFRVAKEKGIKPNEMPTNDETKAVGGSPLAPAVADQSVPHVPSPAPISQAESDATKERIIEMLQGGKSAPEVAKELTCKVQKVTAVWREHQKRVAEQAGADDMGDDDGETSDVENREGAAV